MQEKLTLEYIKNNFNPLDTNTGPGNDAYVEGAEIVKRNNVALVIKHPTENQYLISKWKQVDWSGFLTGGIEGNESKEETAKKELVEESGFKNIRKVTDMNFVSNGLFYHVVKKQNRLAHYNLVFIELEDLEQNEVSEEEKLICDFVWVEESKVVKNLKRDDMKNLWNFYLENR
jgi:8-oxo-dGTP pyrophosphatase MutT (NUDIX family)